MTAPLLRDDLRTPRRWDRVWRDRPGFFQGNCNCCATTPQKVYYYNQIQCGGNSYPRSMTATIRNLSGCAPFDGVTIPLAYSATYPTFTTANCATEFPSGGSQPTCGSSGGWYGCIFTCNTYVYVNLCCEATLCGINSGKLSAILAMAVDTANLFKGGCGNGGFWSPRVCPDPASTISPLNLIYNSGGTQSNMSNFSCSTGTLGCCTGNPVKFELIVTQ